ncbi:MAG: helix-turn-helix domain-containing protein [Actinobacteria bacterium]|nr:helix-turn-helix domain-containing protein [Actinomycetota bacterium]
MDSTRDIEGISALADPLRRDVYQYVIGQRTPVSRDQAATALGVPKHQASFHLDRLEQAGLLAAEYVRLTGRTGPGAGRPAKVYRRCPEEVAVSLPARQYELAGEILAGAVDEAMAANAPVRETLGAVATRRGVELAASTPPGASPIETATCAVRTLGYEPRPVEDRVVMDNCPFHALTKDHAALVCGLNHALLGGLCDSLGGLTAVLEPGPDRCCVVIEPAD